MADTSPKKKVAAKPMKPAAHPKYSEMVGKAIVALKERGGSSRQAILKYIMANFNVGKDAKTVNVHLKLSLRAGGQEQELETVEGNWCFRVIQDRRSSQTQKEACSQTKGS